MKNEKKTLKQNQEPQKIQPLMYSDAMSAIRQMLESENLLTKEQETKEQKSKQENTIEVMFLNRSKKRK